MLVAHHPGIVVLRRALRRALVRPPSSLSRSWVVLLIIASTAVSLDCQQLVADRRVAQAAVANFHDSYNAQHFKSIYDTSDPLYRSSVSPASATQLLRGIRELLGPASDSRTIGINVSVDNGRSVVTLVQRTSFVRGVANETFSFRVGNGAAALISYRIDSEALKNLGRLQRS
jgi:hypothetical protein